MRADSFLEAGDVDGSLLKSELALSTVVLVCSGLVVGLWFMG